MSPQNGHRPLYQAQQVRLALVRTRGPRFRVTGSRDVADAFQDLAEEARESVWIMVLNGASEVVCVDQVAIGTDKLTHIEETEIVRTVLLSGASYVILVHNHPSGDPEPSPQDSSLTLRVVSLASLFNITVRDHVIIGSGGRYYSFYDRGTLPTGPASGRDACLQTYLRSRPVTRPARPRAIPWKITLRATR